MNNIQAALFKAGVVTYKEVKSVVHEQNEQERRKRLLDKEERKVRYAENVYKEEKMIDQQIYTMTGKINLVHATVTVMKGIKVKAGRAAVDYKKLRLNKGKGNGN